MTDQQNPIFDITQLDLIKNRFLNNIAESKDLEALDYFFSTFGIKDYILNRLKESGISSYELYLQEKKNTLDKNRDKLINITLFSVVIAVITTLTDYFNKSNKL